MEKAKILLYGLLMILTSSLASAALTDGLIAVYESDNDGTFPDSFQSLDMSVNGAAYQESGFIDGCYDYDASNDYMYISDSAVWTFVNGYTFSAWVYIEGVSPEDKLTILDKSVGSGDHRSFIWGIDDTSYKIWYLFSTDGTYQAGNNLQSDNLAVATNTWVMVTVVHGSDGNVTFYVNATVDKAYTGLGASCNDNAVDVRVGMTNDNNNEFNGDIDDLKIWNRTLTPSEVSDLYNYGIDGTSYPWPAPAPASNFIITAVNGYDESAITGFNATVNGTSYGTSNTTILTSILVNDTGLYDIVVFKDGYYNASYDDLAVSSNFEADLYPLYTVLNISAWSISESKMILNVTVDIVGEDDADSQQVITTNGSAIFWVTNQTYNVTVAADGYADNYGTSALIGNWTAMQRNYKFSLYTENSFNFTFKNEGSQAVITGTTIYLDLISDLYSANYSTATGYIYADLLTPGDYIFRYYGTGFQPRLSSYTLTASTYNQITLWLLDAGANVSIYVYNQASDPVEAARILIYRYSSVSNSYILVNTIDTDFTGSAVINLQLNSEFYKFAIYYNGVLKKQTAGAYITGTELTFEINIDEIVAQTYYDLGEITGYVSFNEDTENFRYYFYDAGGTISQGCLYVYTISSTDETLYNSTCEAGLSALILMGAENVTGQTYSARGYVTIGSTDYLIGSYTYTYAVETDTGYGSFGILIVLFLTILAGTIMIWDITVSLIILPLPTLIGTLQTFRWINLPTQYALGIEIGSIILAFLIRRR